MTCGRIEPELVGYHFDALDEGTRGWVEEHLVGCPACVRAFVALKRAIETSEDVVGPSPDARARVRRAVARQLGAEPARWAWWERPAALAIAASVVLVAGATTHALTTSAGTPPYALSH